MNNLRNHQFSVAFGKRLRLLRVEAGYTLRQFALEIGIEHSLLSKIERGIINPTISTVYAISEGLKLPLTELFNFKYPTSLK